MSSPPSSRPSPRTPRAADRRVRGCKSPGPGAVLPAALHSGASSEHSVHPGKTHGHPRRTASAVVPSTHPRLPVRARPAGSAASAASSHYSRPTVTPRLDPRAERRRPCAPRRPNHAPSTRWLCLPAQKRFSFGARYQEQLFATHVLVACRNVAFLDVKFACPAWQGVFIVADQGVLAFDQVPGKRAATKSIGFIPRQMTPPGADHLPRRATAAAGQERETTVFHVVQMKDAFQARHQPKHARQQTAIERGVVVAEARLRSLQPLQGLRHQQARTRELRRRDEKGGAGNGTGWPGGSAAGGSAGMTGAGGDASGSSAAASLVEASAAAPLARSTPYFLRNL